MASSSSLTNSVAVMAPLTYVPPGASSGSCSCNGSSSTGCGCGSSSGGSALATGSAEIGLERTRYFSRQRVGPEDLTQDQIYFADRLRRHNRFLHGWGISCGLVVTRCADANNELADPCLVKVSAGYGLDPFGNEVFVPTDVVIDLCLQDSGGGLLCPPSTDPWCSPLDTVRSDEPRFLAVRHIEVPVKPVRGPAGCSCDDTACEYSRTRDWYEFTLLDTLPSHYDQPCTTTLNPCEVIQTCPPCPESGWLVLATITVSDNGITAFSPNRNRRYLFPARGACLECGQDQPEYSIGLVESASTMVATASANADRVIALSFNQAGAGRAEAYLSLNASEIEGRTVAEIRRDWDHLEFLPTGATSLNTPTSPVTAGMLLAHSNLDPDTVINSVDELTAMIGSPIIDSGRYFDSVDEVREILDRDGFAHFEDQVLTDPRRVGELNVGALKSLAKVNSKKLAAAGIITLDDIRRADELPNLSPAATQAVINAKAVLEKLNIDWAPPA